MINVKDFGALGNGAADDTAAIQAALDAAGAVRGTVLVPSSAKDYRFSALRIPAYVTLCGEGIGATTLKRLPGSTGNAVQETSAKYGATRVCVANLMIDGNGTDGNGIDLGNQLAAYPMASGSRMNNVFVWNFPTGIAINLRSNAEAYSYLWGVDSRDGIVLAGGGANQLYALYAEDNSRYQIKIDEPWSYFSGIQIESAVANDAPLIHCNGAGNTLSGIYLGYTGKVVKPALILNAAGKNNNAYRDIQITGSGAFTHGVRSETFGCGSGRDTRIFEYLVGVPGSASSWYLNASTGQQLRRTDSGAW